MRITSKPDSIIKQASSLCLENGRVQDETVLVEAAREALAGWGPLRHHESVTVNIAHRLRSYATTTKKSKHQEGNENAAGEGRKPNISNVDLHLLGTCWGTEDLVASGNGG